MKLRFQPCTISHLDELVRISRKTFIDAFEAVNDPKDFKEYIDVAFEGKKLFKELNDREISYCFVYNAHDLVGYFKLNENEAQTDIKAPEALEVERIYVLEEFQGNSIGQHILDYIKKLAVAKKKNYLWLGVWEKNTNAIKFYEKHGFSKFGMHPYYIGKDKQMDWLMRFEIKNKVAYGQRESNGV